MERWRQVCHASQFQRNHQICSGIVVRCILCANSKPSWHFWCVMNLDPNWPLDVCLVTNAGLILLKKVHFAVQTQDIQRCAYASSWLQFGLSWKFKSRCSILQNWQGVVKVSGISKSIWPESQVDGSWPSLARVQQLLPSTFTKITNDPLGNPIWKWALTQQKVRCCLALSQAYLKALLANLSLLQW